MPSKLIVRGAESSVVNNDKDQNMEEVKHPCVECGSEACYKSKVNGDEICMLHKLLLHHYPGCEVEDLEDAPSIDDQIT